MMALNLDEKDLAEMHRQILNLARAAIIYGKEGVYPLYYDTIRKKRELEDLYDRTKKRLELQQTDWEDLI